MNTASEAIEILLVEDSATDVLIARAALEHAKVLSNLRVVSDGSKALDFLYQQGEYRGMPRPSLILLDLNLPKKNGTEVLREIKSSESLRTIPVVVLTTSNAEQDIHESYGLHANCYIIKPLEFEKLACVVRDIHRFWFVVVTLPKAAGKGCK